MNMIQPAGLPLIMMSSPTVIGVDYANPQPKHRMLRTEFAGLSVCLKKTKCRSCWRSMPPGEKRFGIFTFRPVGHEQQLQKYIQKFICLPCAREDMVELFKEIRAFRRKINQGYKADQAYYVAMEMGGGDGAEKKIVKKRADKEWSRRNNLRQKVSKEVVETRPGIPDSDAKKLVRRIVGGPQRFMKTATAKPVTVTVAIAPPVPSVTRTTV